MYRQQKKWRRLLLLIALGVITGFCLYPRSWGLFLREFIKDPSSIGALGPSSYFVSQQLTSCLCPDKTVRHILEAGAGSGAVTAFIAACLKPGDVFDVVELKPALCQALKDRFKGQQQVRIHCMSLMDWKPPYTYDYIISTLPFSAFDGPLVHSMIDAFKGMSGPDTIFSYVEYRGAAFLRRLFASTGQKARLDEKNLFLSELRRKGGIKTSTEWRSIPPAYIHHLYLARER